MKLYYAETIKPQMACAVAKYLELPIEYVRVDLDKDERSAPAFPEINPDGMVPVLEVDGKTLWEANAIMCFLAHVAGSDLWPRDERQIDVVRWLGWGSEHFTRHAGMLVFEHMTKLQLFGDNEPDSAVVDNACEHVRKYGAVLDAYLDGREYLVGDRLSIADFAVAITLPHAKTAGIPLDGFTAIERWHARLNELPAWREPFPVAA